MQQAGAIPPEDPQGKLCASSLDAKSWRQIRRFEPAIIRDDFDVNDDRISCDGSEAKDSALDWVYLARQTFGDAELEFELLCAFRVQAEVILHRLRGSQPMADWEKADFAHLLKGSARAIGAIRVGSACEAYEALLADAGPSANDALRDLAEAVAEAIDEIDQSLAERSFEETQT